MVVRPYRGMHGEDAGSGTTAGGEGEEIQVSADAITVQQVLGCILAFWTT
jgi:hypothetical protein